MVEVVTRSRSVVVASPPRFLIGLVHSLVLALVPNVSRKLPSTAGPAGELEGLAVALLEV